MSNNNVEATYSSMDEIVFQNRNKEYGAYDLRKKYPSILTKSFLIGSLGFLLAVAAPFIYMKIKAMNNSEVNIKAQTVEILEEEEIIEEIKEEEPPPPPPKEEPKIEIVQNIVPDPVKAPKIETPPPPVEVTKNTTVGTINQEGEKTPVYTPPPPPPGPTKSTAVEVKPQVSETQVYTEVEQLAEFKGGINAFRSKVQNGFDTSVMDGDEGKVTTEITFVVERDGSITDVKANGKNSDFNAEAIRTIKSIRDKWTPAKVNGQSVRYRFRLPLTMQFE
jgi:protein TonB